MATLPPPQPTYIFRGHTSQIHSVHVVHHNSRLITGDADGWVVCWKLESKRPVAVWRAHDASILGTGEWGVDKVITHGRDNALRIWQLRAIDESAYSTLLPADSSTAHRPKPWLLHSLPVNTLNFASFSMCHTPSSVGMQHSDSILVAVPSRDDKKIEVYQFPDEKLVSMVPRVQPIDTGMVMAVKLAHHLPSNRIIVIAGYEGGFTAAHLLDLRFLGTGKSLPDFATLIYLSQPHTQPVLSLDASPDANMYFTSSADALIAAHRIPESRLDITHGESVFPAKASDQFTGTRSTAKDSTQIPKDSTCAEEAEFSDPEVSDITTIEPLACPESPISQSPSNSFLSFPKQTITAKSTSTIPTAGLSSLLSSIPTQSKIKPATPSTITITIQPPYKTSQTKHAGQQSLCVRSDGRLLVTGGWDSRVRVYSAKTLKELAVLKWHKEGVYAVAFGEVLDGSTPGGNDVHDVAKKGKNKPWSGDGEVVAKDSSAVSGLSRLQKQREEHVKSKHWVAAGSKDGKVSLWEVF